MGRIVRSALWRLSLALAVGAGIVALFSHGLDLLGLLSRGREEVSVFSSRRSPDGAYVAESTMVGPKGPEQFGRLVVRGKDGSERSVDFGSPAPDVFLRWIDDGQLELWTDRHPLALKGVDHLGDVSLVARTYVFPSKPSYEGPGSRKITVPAQDVKATFDERLHGDRRLCALHLAAGRTPSFGSAGVEIRASVGRTSGAPVPRFGISTWFTLDGSRDEGPQTALTSATIANIGSYNQLPDGKGGDRIRGQFLGANAARLIDELAKPAVTIDFSRDFFEEVLSFELPLSGTAASDFRRCVGDSQPW